ncbi:hypothetical protein EA_SCOWL_58 [Mycobacterium phage Scowl]|nr:hypothetical protein EA_SCOWL_58 [Mycobacterium phage Scowl]QOC55861.1 hypothetical protein SEA_JORGENSEN_58 [Mycobacterium phage Jorgensen]
MITMAVCLAILILLYVALAVL